MKKDVVIIGGSAAGLMAAMTLKKRAPEKSVTLIRNVTHTPVPCGIPYIYGTMGKVEKNLIPDQGFIDQGIDILQGEVVDIDRSEKEVVFDDGERLGYDKLLIATGSKPFVPPLSGIEKTNVFTIKKDPQYLNELYSALEPARNVVVIGGGFIGVEMAEQIALMGKKAGAEKKTTVVEMMSRCLMLACEDEFGGEIEEQLAGLGIDVKTNAQAREIIGNGRVEGVSLADGEVIPADAVIIGIGARPNIDLAVKCGLEADPCNGISVDRHMQTADPDIFAAGDCATKFSCITGKPSNIRLASVACSEGMIAASNLINGKRRATMGALGAFSTMVGGRSVASAGLTSNSAAEEGIEFVVGEAKAPNRHPAHLPGSVADMRVKLLFRKDDGRVIGGHVSGGEAASDMANIIAAAIQSGLTAEQLAVMQYATHPLLTASPLNYHVMMAAENASAKLG